jgi:hypothetical protein
LKVAIHDRRYFARLIRCNMGIGHHPSPSTNIHLQAAACKQSGDASIWPDGGQRRQQVDLAAVRTNPWTRP